MPLKGSTFGARKLQGVEYSPSLDRIHVYLYIYNYVYIYNLYIFYNCILFAATYLFTKAPSSTQHGRSNPSTFQMDRGFVVDLFSLGVPYEVFNIAGTDYMNTIKNKDYSYKS